MLTGTFSIIYSANTYSLSMLGWAVLDTDTRGASRTWEQRLRACGEDVGGRLAAHAGQLSPDVAAVPSGVKYLDSPHRVAPSPQRSCRSTGTPTGSSCGQCTEVCTRDLLGQLLLRPPPLWAIAAPPDNLYPSARVSDYSRQHSLLCFTSQPANPDWDKGPESQVLPSSCSEYIRVGH